MSQPVLLKVYGNLWPAPKDVLEPLASLFADCMPEPEFPPARLDDELLTIAFEGIYFPVDEILAVLSRYLTVQSQGKLDVIDLENWRLVRHMFKNGNIETRTAPLNNVLDYSGH